jgi:hypothetical protein
MPVPAPYKFAVLLKKLHGAGCGPIRKEGAEFRCRCPAHDDHGPSLYVATTAGKILLNCKGGCTCQAVCDRLDHAVADLNYASDEPWVEVDDSFDIIDSGITSTEPSPRSGGAPGRVVAAESHAEDLALRNEVYTVLLNAQELSTTHFDDPRRRGLSAEEITRRGYRTADAGRLRQATDELLNQHGRDRLLTVPGFDERGGRVVFRPTDGLLIPVRQTGGAIAAIKVRHDDARGGPGYSWASSRSASCGNVVHVPLGVPGHCEIIRLTEGELKADVATVLSRTPTISAPGVANWHLAVPVFKDLGARRVLLAMDRDGKRGTLAAVEKALYGLTPEGFDVWAEWWDGALGKGIDDLLAAGRQPEVVSGLVAAVRVSDELSPPSPAPPDDEPEPPPLPGRDFPAGPGRLLPSGGRRHEHAA